MQLIYHTKDLDRGTQDQHTALHLAVIAGHFDIVRNLVFSGAPACQALEMF